MKHTKYTITVPADKSSQSPERQLRRDNENAVSPDTGSVCSALKFSRQSSISVFALIGMLLVLSPSHLRADEEKALTEALKKDLQDINNYSPFKDFHKLYPASKDTWAYLMEKSETRLEDWKKAADAGIPEGQVLLGHYYLRQGGRDRNIDLAKEGKKLYRKAAEQGNADGQYHYAGWSHYYDNDNPADWYRKAAEQGHARAQYALAEALHY